MTVTRVVLLAMAVLALADGDVCEAVGIVGVVIALAMWPRGGGRRWWLIRL